MIRSLWNKYFGNKAVSEVAVEGGCVKKEMLYRDVIVNTKAEDAPAFKRQYKAVICENIDLRIDIENGRYRWDSDRIVSGVLNQPGRGYVFFDPNSIAEKVLIPEVVTATQSFLRHVMELDAEFVKSRDRFEDNNGRVWVLVNEG